MFNDKINDEPTGNPLGNPNGKNDENQSDNGIPTKSSSERISGADFPRLKVGVLVSPRADGLFVGTFDDALIIDLPGARAALDLCDGSKSINSIATSVGILESDLIELISTLDSTALVTFEKVASQKLLPEMQLIDWYRQFATSENAESMRKRINATIYISKLNRIGFALSGILLASGIGAVISDDNRKITIEDIVGGYLRLSDVGRTRNEVLIDQSRENARSKKVNNLSNVNTVNNVNQVSNPNHVKNSSLIISTSPPDPELLAEWMRGNTPFFLIDGLDRDNLTFGPFVNPGKDACPRCIDLHHLDRDSNWNSVSLAHFLDRRRELSTPLAMLGASIGAILALTQLDYLDQHDHLDRVNLIDRSIQGADQRSSQFQLRGKTITYSASELMHPIIRRWSRHPLCGCSWQ
ncbi:unannotated protein [freshwater metagenome]|uniref:Unannotated protein n=1 Tax=freshwater metagenome TaxID=449393 RepID=A0A6J7UJY5_9ZZZZ|nr:hypothetical protein [Actinomycetota bacterium]